jgi:hypothetical protein
MCREYSICPQFMNSWTSACTEHGAWRSNQAPHVDKFESTDWITSAEGGEENAARAEGMASADEGTPEGLVSLTSYVQDLSELRFAVQVVQ